MTANKKATSKVKVKKETDNEVSKIIRHDDQPIKSSGEDILGRAKFSKYLAKAILNWGANLPPKKKESLVIGINAEWGSGKSSVINMTEKELENNKNVVIIKFNPWAFSAGNNLGPLFFMEISNQLEKKDKKGFVATIKGLRNYSGFMITISTLANSLGVLSPEDAAIATGITISANAEKLLKQYGGKHRKSEKETRELLRDELGKQDKKIVVVIDDIDRLTGPEVKQILRLIRVNGDFPNMIYLLAFDRLVIEKLLSSDNDTSGKDYLEKIVQVNLQLPAAKDEEIYKFLEQELDIIKQSLPKDLWKYFKSSEFGSESDMINVLGPMCGTMFKNIRDVKRFINSLNFKLQQVCNEGQVLVSPVDFAALEMIRLFVPTFYKFIKDYPNFCYSQEFDELERLRTYSVSKNRNMPNNTPLEEAVIQTIENKELSKIILETEFKDLIIKMFSSSNSGDYRMRDSEFFDSYFTLRA
ncbi:MAG: hypothetical protein HAW61_04930 [Candidatus Portiera sp.]|nr:hypothetical protein [Portiera sp.]